MSEVWRSTRSPVSDLSDDRNQSHMREDHELDNMSRMSTTTYSPFLDFGESEVQHLVQTYSHTRAGATHKNSQDFRGSRKTSNFFQQRNPITSAGRHQIKVDLARSGPLTRAPTDPNDYSPSGIRYRWKLYGWRYGIFISTITVSVCLLIEIVMLICAISLNKSHETKDGIGVLYEGSCAEVERLTNILAIPLNVIATILLATSNYVMQCLCAPTRKDVDKAHASGRFLNIGIPSVHNLIRNFSWKSVLWLILVLSSVPIHLLLNSAFFGALQANNYGVVIAHTDWKDIGPSILLEDYSRYNGSDGVPLASGFVGQFLENLTSTENSDHFQRLSKDDCFAKYSAQIQTTASNVLVVTTQDTKTYSILPKLSVPVDLSNPMHAFRMRDGVGLNFYPFSGNAIPILDENYHWIHKVLPQNTSGGLYPWEASALGSAPQIQSVFSAFDYHYWMTIQQLEYDFNNSAILRAAQFKTSSWLCNATEVVAGQSCTSGKHPTAPSTWQVTPEEFIVDYCISQAITEKCSLQYSFVILLVVIICDLVKIVAMSSTLIYTSGEPLATIGDAIASFLERPDPTTRGCCMVDQRLARQICRQNPGSWYLSIWNSTKSYRLANKSFAQRLGSHGLTHKQFVSRWLSVPSTVRWVCFGILYAALFASSTAVLTIGIQDLRQMGINDPFNQGFGSVNPNAIFAYRGIFDIAAGSNTTIFSPNQIKQTNKERTLFSVVTTVNTPQLLFSALYFMYNAMFTSMVAASEWSRFATIPKALRVSQPRLGQRSSYWLQLPWKFSLPLLCMSIVLHLLVARSLFVVRINVFGWDGLEQPDRNITACGYSPLAILLVILVVILSLIILLVAGWTKLNPDIPVCGTNSVAISAACHYNEDGDHEITMRPLLWGVVKEADDSYPGHCSMSDKVIGLPITGMTYA